MEADKWIEIGNTFRPFDSVPPERLDAWFVTRPDSPVSRLTLQLSPGRHPQSHILVGQPASGKSSELTKLAAELQKNPDAFVVRFDMSDVTDVERANPVEVIYLMGAALFLVATYEKINPSRELLDTLTQRLETVVHKQTDNDTFKIDIDKLLGGLVVYAGAVLAAPMGAAAAAGAAAVGGGVLSRLTKLNPFRFASGTSVETIRKTEVEPQIEAMIEALNQIIADVQAKSRRSIVMLVDGLDKLRDQDTIKVNFVEKKFLNGPRCSVLYAGPLDLYYSAEFGEVRTRFHVVPFSHVKVRGRDKDSSPHPEGRAVLRDVVEHRLRSLDLRTADVIEPAALEMLIDGSGGVMRDFIRLMQFAALEAQLVKKERIEVDAAVRVLNDLRRQLMAQLTPDYDQVIKAVRKTHKRVGGPDAEKCDLLLRNDVVLGYFNDDIWYDVHAALTDKPWSPRAPRA